MADALQFGNVGNFSRWFKGVFTVSPEHYKKGCKQQKSQSE